MGVIARYANKTFSVSLKKVYTFDNLTFSGDLNTETQEVNKKKPSTYIKGPDLEAMSFTVKLNQALGINVQYEIDSWCAIRDKGIAHYFILGSKPLRGCKWLLKGCEIESQSVIRGEIVKANLKLNFEEYVRPGTYAASKAGVKVEKAKKAVAKKTKTKKSNVPQRIDINSLIDDKISKTRNNSNFTAAVQKGVKK